MDDYKKNSLSLTGAVALGTGVMIGAGIFALLGQVAEHPYLKISKKKGQTNKILKSKNRLT